MITHQQIQEVLDQERNTKGMELVKIKIPDFYQNLISARKHYFNLFQENIKMIYSDIPKGVSWLAIHNIQALVEIRESKIFLIARESQESDVIDTTILEPEEIDLYQQFKQAQAQFRIKLEINQIISKHQEEAKKIVNKED